MTILLDWILPEGQRVTLLGEQWTGGLRIRVNNVDTTLPRGNTVELLEKLQRHLEFTADCPRCEHPRLEHFRLWTAGGHLNGCSHGTGEGWQLSAGLPCDCPGMPE